MNEISKVRVWGYLRPAQELRRQRWLTNVEPLNVFTLACYWRRSVRRNTIQPCSNVYPDATLTKFANDLIEHSHAYQVHARPDNRSFIFRTYADTQIVSYTLIDVRYPSRLCRRASHLLCWVLGTLSVVPYTILVLGISKAC